MKTRYTFFADPGHGWLSVPLSEIKELGIADKISDYSYINGKSAYLEEDLDAGTFLDARTKAGYSKPSFKESHTDDRSPIRNYRGYSARAVV
jgi:hypothetical protein